MADDARLPLEAGWSSARVEQLQRHHALGLSAAVSAELIGGVSRNAVISKRRRLGLVGANPLRVVLRNLQLARRDAPDGAPPRIGRRILRCDPLPDMDWPPPPGAEPSILARKQVGQCAWPLGPAEVLADYRTRFCCAPTDRRQSYCPAHRARAFAPQTGAEAADG